MEQKRAHRHEGKETARRRPRKEGREKGPCSCSAAEEEEGREDHRICLILADKTGSYTNFIFDEGKAIQYLLIRALKRPED